MASREYFYRVEVTRENGQCVVHEKRVFAPSDKSANDKVIRWAQRQVPDWIEVIAEIANG